MEYLPTLESPSNWEQEVGAARVRLTLGMGLMLALVTVGPSLLARMTPQWFLLNWESCLPAPRAMKWRVPFRGWGPYVYVLVAPRYI